MKTELTITSNIAEILPTIIMVNKYSNAAGFGDILLEADIYALEHGVPYTITLTDNADVSIKTCVVRDGDTYTTTYLYECSQSFIESMTDTFGDSTMIDIVVSFTSLAKSIAGLKLNKIFRSKLDKLTAMVKSK